MTSRPVLCDVDGTLLDSRPVEKWGWSKWAGRHRLDPAPFVAGSGVRAVDLIAKHAPHLNPVAELADLAEIVWGCPFGPTPLPGAAELLATTPTVALVTSGTRAIAELQLKRAGLSPPTVLVTADDVGTGKPHPEPYLKAATLLEVAPARCLVLEDAIPGVVSGKAAGMTVVAVLGFASAGDLRAAGAELVVADVPEFLSLRDAGRLPDC